MRAWELRRDEDGNESTMASWRIIKQEAFQAGLLRSTRTRQKRFRCFVKRNWDEAVVFQNGKGPYFGAEDQINFIDDEGAEAFATCCGVNLAGNVFFGAV
jgi:hypothetical protein